MGKEGACAAPRNTRPSDRKEREPFHFGSSEALPAKLRAEVDDVMTATKYRLSEADVARWVDAASGRCVA